MVLYALDGVIQEPLQIKLDPQGEGQLDRGKGLKAGVYTFVAVRREAETGWVTVSKSITVR
jgi:hypothetical protein